MSNSAWIVVVLILLGCTRPIPHLDGVDLEKWKNDRNGCRGDRSQMTDAVRQEKDKLQGLTESQIRELLGRPDQNELYKRNQKFFYYFISPGPSCTEAVAPPLRLVVRFNATERAKEIAVE